MLGLFVRDQDPEKRIDNPGEDRLMKEKVGQTPYTSHVVVLLGQACLFFSRPGEQSAVSDLVGIIVLWLPSTSVVSKW